MLSSLRRRRACNAALLRWTSETSYISGPLQKHLVIFLHHGSAMFYPNKWEWCVGALDLAGICPPIVPCGAFSPLFTVLSLVFRRLPLGRTARAFFPAQLTDPCPMVPNVRSVRHLGRLIPALSCCSHTGNPVNDPVNLRDLGQLDHLHLRYDVEGGFCTHCPFHDEKLLNKSNLYNISWK